MPRPKNRKRIEQARAAAAAKWAKRDALNSNSKESVDSTDREVVEETMASPKRASRKKIAMMNAAANIDEVQEQNWILLHVSQLTRLICDTSCPVCEETGLSVNVCEGGNAGFAAKLVLRCDLCGYEKFQYSSPRIGDSDKEKVAFEVNRRMTMFSHEMGGSHNVLQTFSSVMGMPGMHLKTFQGHDKKVSAAEILSGTALAERTAATIREAYAETDEDLREALNAVSERQDVNTKDKVNIPVGLKPEVEAISCVDSAVWVKQEVTSVNTANNHLEETSQKHPSGDNGVWMKQEENTENTRLLKIRLCQAVTTAS